jgi:hypothetical protein
MFKMEHLRMVALTAIKRASGHAHSLLVMVTNHVMRGARATRIVRAAAGASTTL